MDICYMKKTTRSKRPSVLTKVVTSQESITCRTQIFLYVIIFTSFVRLYTKLYISGVQSTLRV